MCGEAAYDGNMKGICKGVVLSAALCCAVHAADVEVCYGALQAGLAEQVGILAGIKDGRTAAALLPALKTNVAKLADLSGPSRSAELWQHIDNTPGAKQELVRLVQGISGQLQRLEKAGCYGDGELKALLAPMLNPGAGRPSGE